MIPRLVLRSGLTRIFQTGVENLLLKFSLCHEDWIVSDPRMRKNPFTTPLVPAILCLALVMPAAAKLHRVVVGDPAKEGETINFFNIHGVKRVHGSYQNRPVSELTVIAAWNAKLDAADITSISPARSARVATGFHSFGSPFLPRPVCSSFCPLDSATDSGIACSTSRSASPPVGCLGPASSIG